VTDKTGSVHKT